jgi:hypothetical protein
MATSPPLDAWSSFWDSLRRLQEAIGASAAINVNSEGTRLLARELVQGYFRDLRPELERLSLAADYLAVLDSAAQRLLELANGRNSKAYYLRVVRDLNRARPAIEAEHELRVGIAGPPRAAQTAPETGLEAAIHRTLLALVPTAALSYQQALIDLRSTTRISFRGTAFELREALREVLDHLAPDAEVAKSEGFALEKDRLRPTMKQKAVFLLRSRGKPKSALGAPRDALERIEGSTGSLARSVYDRGSLTGHVASTRGEVLELKLYVESVLAELLEILR